MRAKRIEQTIAHVRNIQGNSTKEYSSPEGWVGPKAQWNSFCKKTFKFPEQDYTGGKTDLFDDDIHRKGDHLYRNLSANDKSDLEQIWRTHGGHGPVSQMPETPLEDAYIILLDGHIYYDADNKPKHRKRDDMLRWIKCNASDSIKRDLCADFVARCGTCKPAFEARSKGHENRQVYKGKKIDNADETEHPNAHPTKRRQQSSTASPPQNYPQQMGNSTIPQASMFQTVEQPNAHPTKRRRQQSSTASPPQNYPQQMGNSTIPPVAPYPINIPAMNHDQYDDQNIDPQLRNLNGPIGNPQDGSQQMGQSSEDLGTPEQIEIDRKLDEMPHQPFAVSQDDSRQAPQLSEHLMPQGVFEINEESSTPLMFHPDMFDGLVDGFADFSEETRQAAEAWVNNVIDRKHLYASTASGNDTHS